MPFYVSHVRGTLHLTFSQISWFTGKRISKNVSVYGLGMAHGKGGGEDGSDHRRGMQVVNTWGGARGLVS